MNCIAMRLLTASALILSPFAACAGDAVVPDFDLANFAVPVANDYFPMVPGTVSTLRSTIKADGVEAPFTLVRTIVGPGPLLLGVQTVAIRDDETEGGLLMERSVDYYATDADGAVWYFGEDVTAYEYDDAGKLLSQKQAPSWTAGVEGAAPGIVIEAVPVPGKSLFRANAPAAKETEYSVVEAVGDVVVVYTESTADPDLRERSTYAKGIGLVATEEDLSSAKDNPKISARLEP